VAIRLATFSIAARDSTTGLLGTAVSTKVPAVGSLCPFIRHGVGAVCTQAWVNPSLGPRILDRLATGEPALDALNAVMANEVDRDIRQVGVVDAAGRSAAFTGRATDAWTGHRTDDNLSVQGNMLVGAETVDSMAASFAGSMALEFSERLMRALEAGQAAGGDRRGKQSAALLIRGPEVYPLVDLRVDEHADPVAELRRIFEVAKRELFPFVAALPSRERPAGDFARIRAAIAPKG
jgi:uncharacterized Ntn-hydrolase superfamily protein